MQREQRRYHEAWPGRFGCPSQHQEQQQHNVPVPALLLMAGGFIFGWAKPVPVTYENLRHKPRDIAFVAVAGPGANFLMAVGWAICMKLALIAGADASNATGLPIAFLYMGKFGVLVNLMLGVLNLLPILPLDGGGVLSCLIPGRWSFYLSRLEPYGFIILLLLLASGVLIGVISPIVETLQWLLMTGFGIV